MAASFPQTIRALESETRRTSGLALLFAAVLLSGWGYWFFRAQVTEWAASDEARIEVDRAVHPIDAPVAGRIVENHVVLGLVVRAGDPLVELDSEAERRRLAAERARLGAMDPELAALERALAAHEQVLVSERDVVSATTRQGQARQREAAAAARLAAEEARRAGSLFDGGAISELDLLRARTEAERRTVSKDVLGLDTVRRREELRTRETRDVALVEQLRRDLVELQGRRAVSSALIDTLTYDIERRKLRAPIDGRVAEAASLRAGAVVKEGEHLGSIVPEGKPRLVALFAPGTALGRVRLGQSARARLDTFPWIEYGSVSAVVTAIASEPRDGKIRVELEVNADENPRIVLEHGLVGTAEISVGRATPAMLLLRVLGRHWTGRSETSS